jgi:hypothetical protein
MGTGFVMCRGKAEKDTLQGRVVFGTNKAQKQMYECILLGARTHMNSLPLSFGIYLLDAKHRVKFRTSIFPELYIVCE